MFEKILIKKNCSDIRLSPALEYFLCKTLIIPVFSPSTILLLLQLFTCLVNDSIVLLSVTSVELNIFSWFRVLTFKQFSSLHQYSAINSYLANSSQLFCSATASHLPSLIASSQVFLRKFILQNCSSASTLSL